MMTAKERQTWTGMAIFAIALLLYIPTAIVGFDITYDYTLRTVLIGSAILGLSSGVLGTYAVLRKQSLLGDTLAHAALPGVAIAFLFFGRELGWLLIGAGISGWLSAMFIQAVVSTTRIKQDAAMGTVLTVMFGFGVALLTYIQSREDASRAGLETFIFGQAASISEDDVVLIGIVTAIMIGVVLIFWKEFKLITFDNEFAHTNGYPVQFLNIVLSTLVVIGIVLSLQLAGVILTVGMLIAPAVAARQWTNHLGQMTVLSGMFGIFAGVTGTMISAISTGLPTGPLIIVAATSVVFVSIAMAPERGLIWQWWQARKDRQAFASEQLLQDIYGIADDHEDLSYRVPEGMLVGLRGAIARNGLVELNEKGFIVGSSEDGWNLTKTGIQHAKEIHYNRQLWQVYRLNREQLGLPTVPEDWRKPIESALSEAQVEQLRSLLENEEK